MNSNHYDVIVIGCGEAGIYAAYELTLLRPDLSVLVCDRGSPL